MHSLTAGYFTSHRLMRFKWVRHRSLLLEDITTYMYTEYWLTGMSLLIHIGCLQIKNHLGLTDKACVYLKFTAATDGSCTCKHHWPGDKINALLMWGHQAHSDSAVVPLFETNLHFAVIYNTAKDNLITLTTHKWEGRRTPGRRLSD